MMQDSQQYQPTIHAGPFSIRFPTVEGLSQDEEWCEVEIDGQWHRIRFHDYGDIYAVPGLYETLFCRLLRCNSPQFVPARLADMVKAQGGNMAELRVFDIGAGNGLGGESLQYLGTPYVVGNDIFPEAKDAVQRERRWVYEDFHIFDLTDPPGEIHDSLKQARFNALTAIGALGFGDIPPKAFQTAYNLVADDGWIAFNIHERFLTDPQARGFTGLIQQLIENQILEMDLYQRYQHRLSIAGEPLFYMCLVGRKKAQIPNELVETVSQ